ncbi:unnamed protein product [Alopecurus aequalis]
MELTWLLFAAALVLPLAFLFLRRAKNTSRSQVHRLPPGPVALPVLGNLLWWTRFDTIAILRAMRRFHELHGPVIAFRRGSRLEITVSDRRLAHTALVGGGAAWADRPDYSIRDFGGINASPTITTSNYGPRWRLYRRNFAAEFVHLARLRLFAPLRASILAELRGTLLHQQEHGDTAIRKAVHHAVFSLVMSMCFGTRIDDGTVRDVAATLGKLMMYGMINIRLFAILPAFTTRLFSRRLMDMHAMRCHLKEIYVPLIEARRLRKKQLSCGGGPHEEEETAGVLPHSYVDTLLDMRLDFDGGRALADDEIVALCSELLVQGTENSVTALEWIMAELTKSPAIQEKLYEEIVAVSGGAAGQFPDDEELLQKMTYLRSVVLEGLRRHPPGHVLVPHATAEDVELSGYVIPKGTKVNVMVAGMGMDPEMWERPGEFVPERFLAGGVGDGVDITCAREIKMMPFGAGRRMCPGIGVATLHLERFVANLVAAFEWQELDGEEVDVDLTAEKGESTVVMKKPLRARLVPRGISV